MRKLLLLLLALPLVLGALVAAQGPPPPIPPRLSDVLWVVRDYSANIQASDRDWYYLNSDGTEL
jgi:hypothetical protein